LSDGRRHNDLSVPGTPGTITPLPPI